MKVFEIEIEKLKPYEKNAKIHPQKQVDLLAKNIERFGFTTPILINENNEVIAGHGRLLALKQLNRSKAIVVRLEGLSKAEVKALRLADNKIAEMGEWDLNLAIGELKELDQDLQELTGFDKDLIIEPDEQDDIIPENAPTRAKLGDIWQLGKHRLLCGDSTQHEAVLALCGDNKVDMLLTDPPYNVDYVGKTKESLKIDNDKMSDGSFRQFLVDAFRSAFDVMKSGAVYYIFHADSEGYNFRGAIHDIGEKVRQCLIWNKNTMVMGRQDYHWKHEPILYGWKEGASHLWNSDRTQVTVLDFIRPTRNKEHPTMKPVEILTYLIGNNTKGEDIVLDLFAGGAVHLLLVKS